MQSLRSFSGITSFAFKSPYGLKVRPMAAHDAERHTSPKFTFQHKMQDPVKISELKGVLHQVQETLDGMTRELDYKNEAVTDSMRLSYLHMAHALLQAAQKAGLTLRHIFVDNHDPYAYMMEQLETHSAYRNYLGELCQLIGKHASKLRKDKNQRTVWEAISYIENHYSEDFGLDQLSDTMRCSSTYLNRLLKQYAGNTFYHLLTRIRIDNSKQLLLLNFRTVNEISTAVGYNNVHSFIRAFKRSEGITPGQFRESNGIDFNND